MALFKNSRAFSVLELSIVLIVVAVVTTMGLTVTINVLESVKASTTQQRMDEIERALMAYRLAQNRLPCPADITLTKASANFGVEAPNSGVCTTGTPAASLLDIYGAEGSVPVSTLNLPETYMFDGWGRKIVYAVDVNATASNAFSMMKPNERCIIEVRDLNDNPITGTERYGAPGDDPKGAVYALISHGANGNGAIAASGTRMAGATNAYEQLNCHCNNTGGPLDVVTHAIFARGEISAGFDDIVRYKERWQMQNDEDLKKNTGYQGPDMAITLTHNAGTANRVQLFERQCGRWDPYTGTLHDTFPTGAQATRAAFSPANSHLVAYKNGTCYVYRITNNAVGPVALLPADTNTLTCPAYHASNLLVMSANGYMVMTQNASPYLKIWKQSGDQFFEFNNTSPAVAITHNISGALPSMPTRVAISKNGTYLILSGATYTRSYYRSAPRLYTEITKPASAPNNAAAIAFSDNERYVAMTSGTTLSIWPVNTAAHTFGARATPAGIITAPVAIAFSPDNSLIVTAGGGPADMLAISTHISLFKIDGTTYTLSTIGGGYSFGAGAYTDIAFSPDSNFIMAVFGGHASKRAMIFRRTGAGSFQLLPNQLEFSLAVGESPLNIKFAH